MKHFKKSLVALLIFAMLLAAVVVTVIAADDAETPVGNMLDARALLDAAIIEEDLAKKSIALGAFYTYTVTNPIAPDTEGYADIIIEYETLSFDVAKQLLTAVDDEANTTASLKSSVIARVSAHLARAPIANTAMEGYSAFAKSYSDKALAIGNEIYTLYTEKKVPLDAVYTHIAAVRTIDYLADSENNVMFKATAAYKDFVKAYNASALAELTAELDKFETESDKTALLGSFYGKLAIAPAIEASACYSETDYQTFKTAYDALLAEYDTHVLAELNAYVALVTSSEALADKEANVNKATALLAKAPILNAEAEAYKTAYTAYNVAMFDVAKLHYNGLLDERDALDAAISAYVAHLAAAPTIIYKEPVQPEYSGTVADALALIEAYKAEGADKLAAFAALYSFMVTTPVDPQSGDPVTDPDGKPVDASGALLPEGATDFYLQGEKIWDEFGAAYAEVSAILSAKIAALDPAASMEAPEVEEGAAPALSPFAENLKALSELVVYLDTTPISREIVEAYNSSIHAFTVRLKGIVDEKYTAYSVLEAALQNYLKGAIIDSAVLPTPENAQDSYISFQANVNGLAAYKHRKDTADKIFASEEEKYDMVRVLIDLINAPLLEYVTPKTPDLYTGDLAVVQALIVAYKSADGMIAKTQAYAAICDYLNANPVNPLLDGYGSFDNAFKLAGEEVYLEFVGYIDGAADYDEKVARIDEMRVYLNNYPISNAAYNAYNVKLLTVYNDEVAKVYAEYKKATDALHELIADSAVLDAIGGNVVIPEEPEGGDDPSLVSDSESSVSAFVVAIDNIEIVEAYVLAMSYKMVYLQDNPTENYVAMLSRGYAIKWLRAYVGKYTALESTVGYEAVYNEVIAAIDEYDAAVEDAKARLDAEAPLVEDELNGGFTFNYDFDNYTAGAKLPFAIAHFDNTTGKNTGTIYQVIDRADGNGKAIELIYGNKTDNGTNPTSGYIEPNNMDSTSGLVMEFDISASDYISRLNFTCTEWGLSTGARVSSSFFNIDMNKVTPIEDGKWLDSAFDGKEVIVPGEWTHIILIYNPDGPKVKLYVDYEYVGEWSVKSTSGDTFVFTALRISCGQKDVSARLDEFDFYQGTAYRNRNRFVDASGNDVSDEEKFKYYVTNMCDEGRSPTDRLYAYEKATALYSSCDAENVGEYMAMYDSLDIATDIEGPAKADNLATLIKYSNELVALGAVTTSNNTTITTAIERVESFITNNSRYLDQTAAEFTFIKEYIADLREDLTSVETLLSFISALKRFDRATTLAAKTKHYNNATMYYEGGEFNLEANRAFYANDPAVLEFELAINGDIPQSNEAYVSIFEYYESCLENLGTQEMWENSKRIIDCVDFILGIEDYEHTEEVWEANYDYVNKYVTIIRDVLRSGNYSPAYPGIDDALAEYEIVNAYFYAILQAEHKEILSAQLVKYPTTNSYIEKLGICTFVDNYIAANDIDMNDEELANLVLTNEVYKKELVIHHEEYAALLEQNTVYFINIVNKMTSFVDYKDIKPLYDEAIVYYYEMNVDSDAAKTAIALFEEYADQLTKQETASAMLLGYAKELEAAKNDADIYVALVNCAAYVNDVTENIEGVSAALELYEAKLAAYNAKVAPMNTEIEQVNDLVSAVRSGSIASAILAVINNIFNR